jgi:Ca2+-binding RTX toxin-like protein
MVRRISGKTVSLNLADGDLGSIWHAARSARAPAVPQAIGPLAGETLVNSFTTGTQANPAVAVLAGGAWVVAWTSTGQDGSGDGVYAQRYTATGVPAGAEFRIATTTANDQRTPSLAALSDGGFIATWQGRVSGGDGFDIYGQRYDAAGAPQGSQFLVNTTTASFQGSSSVAGFPGGGFVVTWHSLGSDETADIYARRYNAEGSPVAGEFRVNSHLAANQDEAAVAVLAGGGFVVTWQSEDQDGSSRGVYGQVYNSAGAPVAAEFRASTTTAGAQQFPAVAALEGGGFVIVWSGNATRGQIYAADGTPVGGEFAIAAGFSGVSVTAMQGGGFAVSWNEIASGGAGDGNGFAVVARAFSAAGAPLGEIVVVNETVTGDQQTGGPGSLGQLTDGSVAVVWAGAGTGDSSGVFLRRYTLGDEVSGPAPIVGTPGVDTLSGTSGDDVIRGLGGNDTIDGLGGSDIAEYGGAQTDYRVTFSNGAYTIEDQREGSPDGTDTLRNIELLRFNGDDPIAIGDAVAPALPPGGHPLTGAILINTPPETGQIMPMTVALTGGGYAVVWVGGLPLQGSDEMLHGRAFDAAGQPVGDEFIVGAMDFLSEEQVPSLTALAGGGFAVAWMGPSDDIFDQYQDLQVQIYNATGAAAGPRLNMGSTGRFSTPVIVGLPDGGFLLVREPEGGTGEFSTTGQLFNSAGAALGAPFGIVANARSLAADVLTNGDIVIAWDELPTDGGARVLLRLFSPTGQARGDAFLVDAAALPTQAIPSVTALAGGGFVMTWQHYNPDADVYARVFDSAGHAVTGSFTVNENTAGTQWYGYVEGLEDGGFLVSWTGDDGDLDGVFARAFDASGQPRGGEFMINPDVAGNQEGQVRHLAQLTNGDLIFSWTGDGAGDVDGVFTRRFGIDDAPGSGDIPPALGGEALVAAGGVLPLIASLSGGGYVVAWPYAGGSYANFAAQVYTAGGAPVGQRIELGSFQFASEENFPSLVGLAGGGFVVAWTAEGTDGNDPGVVQQFNANGTPAAARVTLATDASSYDMHAVAAPDGGYLVLFGQNSQSGMSAQRFDANGAPVGSVIQFPNLGTSEPGAAFLANGNLAIANGPASGNLLLSIYSPAGTLLHSATLPSPGLSLSLAALDGGGLVVVWENGGDVFGQRYDAQAGAQGLAFSPATTTADTQDFPSIHSLSNGGFVVSWQSAGQDGDGDGLYARLFDANGQPASDEFLVNQTTTGNQRGDFVNVTQIENGDLVFTWWGNGSDGSGVYMRRFDLDGAATGPIVGTPGPDRLIGTAGADVIQGLAGNDFINGMGGADDMQGGQGDDVYAVDAAGDLVTELTGEGTDTVYTTVDYALATGSAVEVLAARDNSLTAAMTLTGNEIANTILGNNGANMLDGKGGADILAGFGGDDIYVVDGVADFVIEEAGGGNDTIRTSVSYALGAGSSVETLAAFDPAATTALALIGNAGANSITGNNGANYLDGNGGVDVLTGLGGNDVYVVSNSASQVIEAADGGSDTVYTDVDFALAAGSDVEVLAARDNGTTVALALTGSGIANTILGNTGVNVLDGKDGADILAGFGGDDIYVVDNSADVVIEGAGDGNDTIRTSVSYALGAGSSVETLAAFDPAATIAMDLIGNANANSITGNNGANYLDGNGGVDVLTGLGGNDTYAVSNPATQVIEAVGGGTDVVYASVSYTLAAGSEVEGLVARDNSLATALSLTGNEFANVLLGDAGANSFDGKGGNDILIGYGGADTFAFTSALGAANVDQVFAFEHGTDRIALDDAVFTAIGGPGALNANAFVTGTAAADADDRIIYNGATGELFYDADGNGAGAAVLFATLQGAPALGAGDFMIV